MSAMTPRPRTRSAGNEAMAAIAAKQKELEPIATTFFVENATANAAGSKAQAARKKLLAGMQEGGLPNFNFTIQTEGGPLSLAVTVDTPDATYMDCVALWKIMECDTKPEARERFFKMVSCTKKAVEEELGKNVATRIEATKTGTTNANVKPVEK